MSEKLQRLKDCYFFEVIVIIIISFSPSCFVSAKLFCKAMSCPSNIGYGFANPTINGIKGDGLHDDTKAIQALLDSLSNRGGGMVVLDAGTYLVSTIKLGIKTSVVGSGIGATIIKQKEGYKGSCIVVPKSSAAFKIADLSISGNNQNIGICIEKSAEINGENHDYLYKNTILSAQPYKWITIDNVCVYHFNVGMFIDRWGWDVNICNSTISHNGTGVVMGCTDSSIYNCYITNNKKNGLTLAGSNNKISNIKSIWNGIGDAKNSAAIEIEGSRNQLVNCETQDNYCKGFMVKGQYNLLSNCISNTDGFFTEPKKYNPLIEACGFGIKGLYNSFSNCVVTSYTNKYGAIYHSPVIVDKSVTSSYSDILENIRILVAKDICLFHEPLKNVQFLNSKGKIRYTQIEGDDGNRYFVSTKKKNNVIKNVSCQTNSFSMLVDFKCLEEDGGIITIGSDGRLALAVEKKNICLKKDDKKVVELLLDDDAVLNRDDIRLIITFSHNEGERTISLFCYEKTAKRGWMKKEVRQNIDDGILPMFKDVDLKIGSVGVPIKRVAITNIPLPESVFLPYSNTNSIYGAASVYFDADSYIQ